MPLDAKDFTSRRAAEAVIGSNQHNFEAQGYKELIRVVKTAINTGQGFDAVGSFIEARLLATDEKNELLEKVKAAYGTSEPLTDMAIDIFTAGLTLGFRVAQLAVGSVEPPPNIDGEIEYLKDLHKQLSDAQQEGW